MKPSRGRQPDPAPDDPEPHRGAGGGALDPENTRPPARVGDRVRLTIRDLANGPAGIARERGFVYFVRGAIPGETVLAEVRKLKGSYAEAEVIDRLIASAERVEPRCPHFGPCGGCQWMDLEYEAQLRIKERHLRDCLERIGGLDDYTMHPIAVSPRTFGYRNKMEF